MKLRLKEEPKEWIKFTGVMALGAALVAGLLHRRGLFDRITFGWLLGSLVLVVGLSLIRPRWFRGFYRGGMTMSWHVGQVMGRILLTVFFLVIVTPMGVILRLIGKDLLILRKPSTPTYWRPAPPASRFDQQF